MKTKVRVNITLDGVLVDKAKKYKINISQCVERVLVKELGELTAFADVLRKIKWLNVCVVCKEHKGYAKLRGYKAFFDNSGTILMICEDCQVKTWNDIEQNLRTQVQDVLYSAHADCRTPQWGDDGLTIREYVHERLKLVGISSDRIIMDTLTKKLKQTLE